MASKLAAGKIAAWSGVRAVIASASRPGVVLDAVNAVPGVGTVVVPRPARLGARKLWIAFALPAEGRVRVDAGAEQALTGRGVSLLPAGVLEAEGKWEADAAVEVCGPDGRPFAKGICRYGSHQVTELAGRRTSELPPDLPHEVIHRDDLVLVP